jgi:hypothetical protein
MSREFTKYSKWQALLLLLVVAASLAWFFRYEIVNKSGGKIVRLDRWSGDIQVCDATACIRPSLSVFASDGAVLQFPQGTSEDIVQKALAKYENSERK